MKLVIPAVSLAAAALLIGLSPTIGTQAQATQPATPPASPTMQATTATPIATPAATTSATMTMMSLALPCTLSAADCQLLSDARGNLAKESSFAQHFNFALALIGDHPVNVQASGTGVFSLDTTNVQDHATLFKAIQFQLDINGSASLGTIQQSGKTGIVLKDGILYGLNPLDDTWTGIDLVKTMTMMRPSTQPATPVNPTDPTNGMTQQQLMANPDFQAGIMGLMNVKGFITQERLANNLMTDGQSMAQIQYTINPQVLFNSADAVTPFRSLLKAMNSMNPQGGQRLTNMNDQQLQGLLKIIGGVFGNTTITETRWIGTTDKLFHAFDIEIKLNIDAGMLMGGTRMNTTMPTSLNGTISFSVQLTKIGQPVTVTAPADATLVNPMQFRRMYGMGLGYPVPSGNRPPKLPMMPAVPPFATLAATSAATPAQ